MTQTCKLEAVRAYLLFLPSTLLGVVGLIVLYFRPFALQPRGGFGFALLSAGILATLFFAVAWALERYLASFKTASRLLERALSRIRVSWVLALGLAALSALAEELFFRAVLLPLVGVWWQAGLFGLMHPAPRKAWSYTLFTFLAGLGFGYLTLLTGRLWPAVLVHFAVNLHGFLEIRKSQLAKRHRLNEHRGLP